jgi:N-methylhydantoinase B
MTRQPPNAASADLDGVSLAILSSRLDGVARKMANTLLRTARSGVINIARDFSCCIVTADCRLITAADSLPIHVLSGPDLMARAMVELHPEMKRGDAFLHNSPYHGCSHAADHTILVPVFDAAGRHRFTVLAKAHQADIGNSIPTTYHGSARDVYEEGALIFPAVRVQADFRNLDDIVRMCRMRIRVPDQWWGDYLAMVAAARIGETELELLAQELGWDHLESFADAWFDYSERRMVETIRAMPAGRAERTSIHDAVAGLPAEGLSIKAKVEVDPQAARIVVDLTDNPDCLPCGLNLSEACSRTAALVGVFNSIDPTVPKNDGSFRRIEVRLRENCIAGVPRHPTSTSVATTNIADRATNAVQTAIAEIADGYGLAECGAVIAPGIGVVSGLDSRTSEPFVTQVFLALAGGAGAPRTDRWLTIGHVGNGGLVFIDSVELDELRLPIRIHRRGFVADTEGAGRQVGAPCAMVEYGPTRGEISIGYVSDGTVNGPRGVRGGHTGGRAEQYRLTIDGRSEPLDQAGQITLEPGERVLSYSSGGGGYGPPAERDPRAVAQDVAEGWITSERARDVYRVALRPDGTADATATMMLRSQEPAHA